MKLRVIARLIGVHHVMHRDPGHGHFGMEVRPQPADAFEAGRAVAQGRAFEAVGEDSDMLHRRHLRHCVKPRPEAGKLSG